jgi:hypothetical protein
MYLTQIPFSDFFLEKKIEKKYLPIGSTASHVISFLSRISSFYKQRRLLQLKFKFKSIKKHSLVCTYTNRYCIGTVRFFKILYTLFIKNIRVYKNISSKFAYISL